MKTIKAFIKNEIVLLISIALAIISSFIVVPNKDYINYIDYRTLALLFSLMAIMSGLNQLGIFKAVARALLKRVKGTNSLALILVLLCFFSSMIITNDVALITFVPFTITTLTLADKLNKLSYIVVLETISANLGSMLTPIGNPQNLYLFSAFNMTTGDFFKAIIPYASLSLIMLVVCCFATKSEKINISQSSERLKKNPLIIVYLLLLLLAILSVFRVVSYIIVFSVAVVILIILDRKTLVKVDYSLLLTFVFLFIFIGNLGNIPRVSDFLGKIVNGNEVIAGIVSSQVISNVPSAILLSGFSRNASALLVGVNLGGLGTLIASMASLISFKLVSVVKKGNVNIPKYILLFTALNIIFLAANLVLYFAIR